MDNDKPCRCVSSRMFPHRESKCSLRAAANPAASFRNLVNHSGAASMMSSSTHGSPPLSRQGSSSAGFLVSHSSPSDTHASNEFERSVLSQNVDDFPEYNPADFEDHHPLEQKVSPKCATEDSSISPVQIGTHVPDKFTAYSPDSPKQPPLAFASADGHLSTATTFIHVENVEAEIPVVVPESIITVHDHPAPPIVAQEYSHTPTYAVPPSTYQEHARVAKVPPQEGNIGNNNNNDNVVNVPSNHHDDKCTCASSRLFPHRASKCSMRKALGVSLQDTTPPYPSSSLNPSNNQDPTRAQGTTAVFAPPVVVESEGNMPALSTDMPQDSDETNAGSRPCRCVSSSVFPHRANKCTLLNTTKAGRTVVSGVVPRPVSANRSTSIRSNRLSAEAKAAKKEEYELQLAMAVSQAEYDAQRRQEIARIPPTSVVACLVQLALINVVYMLVISVVLLLSFGAIEGVFRVFAVGLRLIVLGK